MKYFKNQLAFWIPYFVFIVTLFLLIIFNEKAELHLLLNSFHAGFLDIFFKYYTEFGGWMPFVLIACLLFYKYRVSMMLLIAQIATGLIVQIAKRMWNAPRPKMFFQEHFPDIDLPQVAGVHLHSTKSFPSGHTASAFALFIGLAFFTKKPALQFMCFVLALLVGYSRIYLSQHFPIDVFVGSIIGVFTTFLLFVYLDKYEMKWADKSLRNVNVSKSKL
jgi:membrane-associated phospholipid phosphatase